MRFYVLTILILLVTASPSNAALPVLPLEETIPLDQGVVYWQQWLSPEDIRQGLPAGGRTSLLRYWHDDIAESKAVRESGFASYVVELPPLEAGRYELGLSYVASAYDLALFPAHDPSVAVTLEVGRPGKTAAEEIPFLAKRAVSFQVRGSQERWLLLMHVSNFSRSEAGFWAVPELSRGSPWASELRTQALVNYAVMGAMIIMALYQLMMFFRNHADRAALYLCLICIGVIIRILGFENVIGEWVPQVYDGAWFDASIRMEYLPMACMAPLFLLFVVHTFHDVPYSRTIVGMILIQSVSLSLYTLLATPYWIQSMLVIYQMSVLGVVIYGILLISRAVKRKEAGSIYILISVLMPFSMAVIDIIMATLGIHKAVSHFGAAVFVFMQSQVLAQRFALAFQRVDHLSRELQREVRHQTAQIRHIMDHVPQGLGLLDRNLALQAVHSHWLEQMFGEQQLASRPFLDLLEEQLVTDRNSMILFRSTLAAAIGESSLTWEMNADQFLRQAQTRDGRYLEIDWHPIVNDNTVQEVLVAVRDVTEIRMLTEKAREQDAELKRIGEILALSPRDRGTLQNLLEQALQECRSVLGTAQTTLEKRRMLLVHLHTLKGSVRQLGLAQLASTVHGAEQAMLETQDFAGTAAQQLDEVRARWLDYHRVMERLQLTSGATAETSLEYELMHMASGLGSLALSQNKHPPTLDLQLNGVQLSREQRQVFGKIWLHLVTNSIEHGLESKPARGTICLQMRQLGNKWELIYADSGRGLNIAGIRAKAERLGLLAKDTPLSMDEIAQLIFTAGFSTRDQVSEASGRGIGMDAIRTLVESVDGSVMLRLLPGTGAYCRFQIVFQLPRAERSEAAA